MSKFVSMILRTINCSWPAEKRIMNCLEGLNLETLFSLTDIFISIIQSLSSGMIFWSSRQTPSSLISQACTRKSWIWTKERWWTTECQ
jgi:hypothetical protein